ncbi:MAG: hypothetical protein GKR88_09105 [Flavobacteriaceae bacterium]|nr:MAG: hypothetical protein GKR88_09105 [Flavobacteriaceae bacterium]
MNKLFLNILTIVLIYLNTTFIFAQERKFKLKSTSAGIGLISSLPGTEIRNNLNLDLATELNKNLFSFYSSFGHRGFFFGIRKTYCEMNLTYGRQIDINNWLKLEGHFGVRIFRV